jgi:hypothetical protein
MSKLLARVALLCGTACALRPAPALAIPVFARIYDKPCGTCHTVFPQLNPDGESFRAHGFHGLPPAVKPLRAGTEFELPGTIPLALYLGTGTDVTGTDPPHGSASTDARYNLQFLSVLAGGELGRHLAFLMDYELLETEPETGTLHVNSLPEQAYFQAHAAPAGWLANLRAGWFELPLGISPRVHRLSAEPYLTYSLSGCGLLGRAPRGVSCDDVPVLSESQIGAELGAQHPNGGFGWSLGATNGSNNRLDHQASRDLYWRISQQIGFHRVGFFLFYSPDLIGTGPSDRTLRLGPDLNWYTRRVRILGQLLANFESNPTGRAQGLWYYGSFVEGEYRVTPVLLALARGEYVWNPTFDDTADGSGGRIRRRLWALTGGGQWLILENLKLVVEATYGENHEAVSDVTTRTWSATVRVVTAFWVPAPPSAFGEWPYRTRTR